MPTYSYNDTPQATQRKNATQPLIRTNFQSINATITQEHLAIDDPGANAGKHKQVTFTNVAAPAFGATEIGIYNNNASGAQELYVKKAGGTGYPFTAGGLATDGWTRLPSGILMKWGSIVATPADVNLNGVAGPNFSNATLPFVAFATPKNIGFGVVAAYIIGPTADPKLELRSQINGVPVYWIVIGI